MTTRHGHQKWLFLFKDMATGRVHTFTATSEDSFEAAFADVRNHTPNVHHAFKSSDHRVNGKATNLSKQLQFAFGDLVAFGIPKELRDWKFDLCNDIGIYVGHPEGTVDAANVYFPDTGQMLNRGSARKIEVSDDQVLRYFQR